MKRLRIKKGLTLLEVIIAMAILSIIVTPILSLSLNATKMTAESEDKFKALTIAQRHMENIKSPNYSGTFNDDSSEKTFEDDDFKGFKITESIQPMKNYKFNNLDSNSNNEEITYDLNVEYGENNNIVWQEAPNFTVKSDASKKNITIENNNNKDVNVKIELRGNDSITINLINNSLNNKMNVYIIKTSENTSNYIIGESIGKMGIYSNVFNDVVSNNSNYRLYKITIKVEKGGKILQNLEGYKTFLK